MGVLKVRANGQWDDVAGSASGGGATVSATEPASPTEGDLWWDSDATPSGSTLAIQNSGVVLDAAATALNFRGGAKTAQLVSGTPSVFLTSDHDIRAYGAITAAEASAAGMTTTAARAQNNTAIQNAINAAATTTGGSRRVRVSGSYNDVYEYSTTLTIGNGVILASDHEMAVGARLHYYGAVNTHAIDLPANTSYFGMIGIRLEDMRGSAAATGTGRGINITQSFNGLFFYHCHVVGFYDNLYAYQSDVIKIEGGWWHNARHYGIHLSNCTNNLVIRDIAVGNHVATYPTMERIIYIDGGDRGTTVDISDVKCEADNSSLVLLWLRTSAAVSVRNLGQRQTAASIADVVRIEDTTNTSGIGATIILDNVVATGGSAVNLLRQIESANSIDTTIPCHTSGDCRIVHWSYGSRELSKQARPNGGAYAWTQAASGTVAGTLTSGTGTGTSPTITCDGDDMQGMITITTGTSPAINAQVLGFNFRVPWPDDVKGVVLTPANANAAGLTSAQQLHVGEASLSRISRRFFRLYSGGTALAASTEYKWNYRVLP